MFATSVSRSGSIKSQLLELFVSVKDMLSYLGKIGEVDVFRGCTVGAGCGLTVPGVEPAQLLGHTKGLLDVEGILIVLASSVLAPVHELGLANVNARSTAFSS